MITDKNRDFLTQYGSKAHIDELIKDPKTSMYVAMNNPAFNHTHIQKILESRHNTLHEILEHPSFPIKASPEQVTELSKSKDPKILGNLSSKYGLLKPHHIENILNHLSNENYDYDTITSMNIANSIDATPEQFDRMVGMNNIHMNQTLSRNRCLPEKHIPKFMNSSTVINRMNISGHPKLTPEHMETLSNDENEFVRSALAKRKDLPVSIIHKLAEDPSRQVRSVISVEHAGK
ncbi:MAG TPA: hypothetical protein VFM18_15765 [Methanosarcina sp.]|nr:hypothetical protein [Methanosarcina sp.]